MLKNQTHVKLQRKLQKVIHCCPAFNNTFVILGIRTTGIECIVHIDADGKVIAQKQYKNSDLYPFGSFDQKHVAFLHPQENLIIQWDLQTHAFIQVPFAFHNQSQTRQLFVYPQSSYFCIVEYGGPSNNYFRLSYFKYPILNKQAQPFHVFDSEGDPQIWTYDYQVKRGNTQSMVIWHKNSYKAWVEFKTYSLQDKQVKQHVINNNLAQQKCEISVGEIWEKNKGQFIIASLTDRQKQTLTDQKGQQYFQYPNSIFIGSEESKELRQAKFALDGKYRIQFIDSMPFGQNCMFRSFQFDKGVVFESPVYYVNHQLQAIVHKDTWKCSHLSKYETVGYDPNLLIQTQYQNGDVEWINFIQIKIINVRQTTAMFLLQLMDTFDEDLIREVVGLIAVEVGNINQL